LSAPNKLLIRCAWAGTAAFASAGYGSGWAPGSCTSGPSSPPPPPSPSAPPCVFTTKASLQTKVQEFNANPTAATATCGPIANWDVSAITDMSSLFYNLKNFDADISGWDTSSVTTMGYMFQVRSAHAPKP
jgi:surface protein